LEHAGFLVEAALAVPTRLALGLPGAYGVCRWAAGRIAEFAAGRNAYPPLPVLLPNAPVRGTPLLPDPGRRDRRRAAERAPRRDAVQEVPPNEIASAIAVFSRRGNPAKAIPRRQSREGNPAK
jgi:hypothetical protein